jgi:hypothetical protein
MAISKTADVSGRRIVYGANAIVQSVLVIAAVIGAVVVAQRFQGQVDFSLSRINSLSSRTANLLKKLDQDIRITAVYVDLRQDESLTVPRSKTVADLLDLYRNANPARIATEVINPEKEPGRVQAILARLREKPAYRDEARPHEQALTAFPALNDRIGKLCKDEVDQMEALAQQDGRLLRLRELAILANNLNVTERQSLGVTEAIAELTRGEVKRYGRAAEEVRKFLASARSALGDSQDWMTSSGAANPEVAPDVRDFFQSAGARYQPILAEIDALLAVVNDLKPVQLEQVYDELSRWSSAPPILVESASEAKVASFDDVWTFRDMGGMPPGPDNDPRQFNGEAAISSLILQLTQTERTAVIFTRWGGEPPLRPDFSRVNLQNLSQLPRAPYGLMNETLQKQNFITYDWDTAVEKTPPTLAEAARRVYVVLPPAPPPQQNPMQRMPEPGISPQDKELILSAVKASGMAMFLAGWKPPDQQAMILGQSGGYDFNEFLKQDWGIDVLSDFLVMWFMPSPEKRDLYWPRMQRAPTLITTDVVRFTDHPIVRPLQASAGALRSTAPLRLLSGDLAPKNVQLEPLLQVERTTDVWAVRDAVKLSEDFRQRNGTFRREDDLPPPFPVAVAGVNSETSARIVVFGSESFAEDSLTNLPGIGMSGGAFVAYLLYPANTDLFLNALHWLTNDSDRIAVGPRTSSVPRLDRLKEGAEANLVRVFIAVIWPALALLVGGGVWLLRRR